MLRLQCGHNQSPIIASLAWRGWVEQSPARTARAHPLLSLLLSYIRSAIDKMKRHCAHYLPSTVPERALASCVTSCKRSDEQNVRAGCNKRATDPAHFQSGRIIKISPNRANNAAEPPPPLQLTLERSAVKYCPSRAWKATFPLGSANMVQICDLFLSITDTDTHTHTHTHKTCLIRSDCFLARKHPT
jgi:hypothetical protein